MGSKKSWGSKTPNWMKLVDFIVLPLLVNLRKVKGSPIYWEQADSARFDKFVR
jgi:hypothetical protein